MLDYTDACASLSLSAKNWRNPRHKHIHLILLDSKVMEMLTIISVSTTGLLCFEKLVVNLVQFRYVRTQ
jgi:hypothetical protein